MKKVIFATLAVIALLTSFVNFSAKHQAAIVDPNPGYIGTGTTTTN